MSVPDWVVVVISWPLVGMFYAWFVIKWNNYWLVKSRQPKTKDTYVEVVLAGGILGWLCTFWLLWGLVTCPFNYFFKYFDFTETKLYKLLDKEVG